MATTYTQNFSMPLMDMDDPHDQTLVNDAIRIADREIAVAQRGKAAYNLLDNSYFLKPVNQRGQTTYTGSGYSIDRWRAFHAGTTHTITASGLAVDTNDGSNPNLYQVLDANLIDTSKTYTAACCDSDGNIYVHSMKPTEATYAPVCLYLSGGTILFRIIGAKTWRWAALYEGEYTLETLPVYVQKGYVAELMECQRHKRKVRVNAVRTNEANNYYMCSFVHNMRVTPTATLLEFAPIGSPSVTDFTGCSISADDFSLIYAKLPTCSRYDAGTLLLDLNADL